MIVLVTGGLLFLLRKSQLAAGLTGTGRGGTRLRLAERGLGRVCAGPPPRALVALLIMFERRRETCQHFGGGFEHGLELGLVHFGDILPKVMNRLFQALAHFARMVD